MKIFLDTSMFIAFFLKQETSHAEVVQKYNYYRHQKATFITSNYILDELFTWFSIKQNKTVVENLIFAIQRVEKEEEVKVLYIDKSIDKKAQKTLLKYSDHKISFTDITTYVLYKEFNLDEVFTLDSDFKKIGLKTSF